MERTTGYQHKGPGFDPWAGSAGYSLPINTKLWREVAGISLFSDLSFPHLLAVTGMAQQPIVMNNFLSQPLIFTDYMKV